MNIIIKTNISGNPETIFQKFDKYLFLKLNFPLVPLSLLRFDGCKTDDEIHLKIAGQHWVSVITHSKQSDVYVEFIDEGKILPFPFVYWKHRHIITKISENESQIIDNINYRTSFFLFDFLMYPLLYFQFLYRKPVYKKVLN